MPSKWTPRPGKKPAIKTPPAQKTPAEMTVAELKETLTAAGVEFDPKAKKAELLEKLSAAME